MTTEKSDVVIIGGGFGGLTCGLALAKAGKSVLVIEKEPFLGGAFQSFRRRGQSLDTGFHYVGGVGEGEVMRPIVTFFGLENLPWKRLDDPFLEVFIRGERHFLPCGYDHFAESLGNEFPEDREALQELVRIMRDINAHLYETVGFGTYIWMNQLMTVSAKTYLEQHFHNPMLRDLLCGQCLTTELTHELPLYAFIQSLNSFIQGAYRLKGGGETLIRRLAEQIEATGGKILTRKTVSGFTLSEDGVIGSVQCADDSEYAADTFISPLHPSLTTELIPDCSQMRKIYRRRMRNLENTIGMFTVQLALKPGTVRYRNQSISIIENDDLWNTSSGKDEPVRNMLVNFNMPQEGNLATNIDLMVPMSWDAVEEWSDSRVGRRPDEYRAFKKRKAEECIAFAMRYIPELQGNIEEYWTSSPLTYRDYTGTPHGSCYGVRKSCNNVLGTVTSPVTPIPNLFLAGQSLMLHGMLGTAMTSIKTCNLICGRNLMEA